MNALKLIESAVSWVCQQQPGRNITTEIAIGSSGRIFSIEEKQGTTVRYLCVGRYSDTPTRFPLIFQRPYGDVECASEVEALQQISQCLGICVDPNALLRAVQPGEFVGVALKDAKPITGTNPVRYEPVMVKIPDISEVANSITPHTIDSLKMAIASASVEELRRHRDELNTIIYDKERGK